MPFPNNTFSKVSPDRLKEIQSSGGKTVTAKQRLGQQMRRLREKGLTDDTAKKCLEMLESSQATALDILGYIEELRMDDTLDFDKKTKLIQLTSNWMKLHHGEKSNVNVNQTQINIITDQEIDDVIGRLTIKK